MTLFPFFFDIENKTFLVIGGGKVAKGKIKRLLPFTKDIIVIAKNTNIENVKVISKDFEPNDIFLGDYVIGATDSKETNAEISRLCRENNIPVNIVDDADNCTFIFPALIKRGNLTVGITSAGKSPAMSQYVRKKIEEFLPDNTEEILDRLGELRQRLKESIPDIKIRSEINKKLLAAMLENENLSDEQIEEIIFHGENRNE